MKRITYLLLQIRALCVIIPVLTKKKGEFFKIMAIVYQHDKRHDVTYVYYSESHYDKEKKQSRSKRTLIGRLDPETKEIVPVRKSKRSKHLPIDIQELIGSKEEQKETNLIPDNDQLTALKIQVRHLQDELEKEKRNTKHEQDKMKALIARLEHIFEEYK